MSMILTFSLRFLSTDSKSWNWHEKLWNHVTFPRDSSFRFRFRCRASVSFTFVVLFLCLSLCPLSLSSRVGHHTRCGFCFSLFFSFVLFGLFGFDLTFVNTSVCSISLSFAFAFAFFVAFFFVVVIDGFVLWLKEICVCVRVCCVTINESY